MKILIIVFGCLVLVWSAFADRCVGRILDGIEANPENANTVVMLWGDHGWHLAESPHYRNARAQLDAKLEILLAL